MLKSVPQENLPVAQVNFPVVELQVWRSAPKKLVVLAVVVKKLVVVAEVPVAFTKVKFCNVEDAFNKRFERVVRPEVTFKVPVKEAALVMVWELMRPEVMAPKVALPVLRAVANRLVEDAVVEKKLVEVALVEVEFRAVKFCRVVEAVAWSAPVSSILNSSVPAALVKERNLPVKLVVEEALIKVPVVPVAFTWKRAERSREAVVVAPTTKDLSGEEVAERKSPATESSRVLPKVLPVSSVSHPNVPPAQVKTLLVWQVANPAPLNKAVKRLVELAVVEKRLVVVALVVVALALVRLVIVEEALITVPATCANATEEICCRGESVSKLVLLEETSTLRKILVSEKL